MHIFVLINVFFYLFWLVLMPLHVHVVNGEPCTDIAVIGILMPVRNTFNTFPVWKLGKTCTSWMHINWASMYLATPFIYKLSRDIWLTKQCASRLINCTPNNKLVPHIVKLQNEQDILSKWAQPVHSYGVSKPLDTWPLYMWCGSGLCLHNFRTILEAISTVI